MASPGAPDSTMVRMTSQITVHALLTRLNHPKHNWTAAASNLHAVSGLLQSMCALLSDAGIVLQLMDASTVR